MCSWHIAVRRVDDEAPPERRCAVIKNVGISFLKRSDLPFRKRAVYKTPVNDLPFWKDLQQMLDEIKHGNVTPV
jgi:hypothetical protein